MKEKERQNQSISHHSSILCISKVQGFGKVFLRQQSWHGPEPVVSDQSYTIREKE